jgi:hypothetical protein
MDGLLDEWMIGFEFKENLKGLSCEAISKIGIQESEAIRQN